ncbi:MAG: hypothetical protein FWC26_00135 [Fibromonadales bacterium]|nr:hypothetical protein [Fibromonadales bacterium]
MFKNAENQLKDTKRINDLRKEAGNASEMLHDLCFSSCCIESTRKSLTAVRNCLEFKESLDWIHCEFGKAIEAIKKHITRLQVEVAHYTVIMQTLERAISAVDSSGGEA